MRKMAIRWLAAKREHYVGVERGHQTPREEGGLGSRLSPKEA